ncbi:MAG: hypothetical protein JXB00_01375 [Bacteroidales bacterium]|nr:hypothetical protein [Bacteroidales bacterium]
MFYYKSENQEMSYTNIDKIIALDYMLRVTGGIREFSDSGGKQNGDY